MSLLRRLRNFYLVQVDLIFRWRKGRRALVRHVTVSFFVALISLSAMAWVVPGIHIRDPGVAVLAVLVFWALNLFLRPVVLAVFAPISTALVVLVTLVLQILVILCWARWCRAWTSTTWLPHSLARGCWRSSIPC